MVTVVAITSPSSIAFATLSTEWESASQHIEIEFTDWHFGGKKPWLLYPARGRRVGKLSGQTEWAN